MESVAAFTGIRNQPSLGELFSYEPETVDSYEIGLKMALFDGHAILNIAAFKADFENRQVSSRIENRGQFGPTITDPDLFLITNAATMSTDGFEMETVVSPVDNMRISLSLGYLDAHYDEFITFDPTTQTLVDVTDRNVETITPDWTVNGNVQYTFNLSGGSTLTPRIIGYYKSGYEWQVDLAESAPKSPIYQDAYTKWDARLTWRNASGTASITLFGQNIFDKDTISNGSNIEDSRNGFIKIFQDAPRTFGVEAQLEF